MARRPDFWSVIERKVSPSTFLVLFIDYDGTLTPLARRPEAARLAPGVKKILARLSRSPRVALCIISGRSVDEVRKLVALPGVIYAGLHGLEINGPGLSFVEGRARRNRRAIQAWARDLARQFSATPGVFIENKTYTVAIHYRQVPGRIRPATIRSIQKKCAPLPPHFHVIRGKMVYEIKPSRWNKGRAVEKVLAFLTRRHPEPLLALYIGDDQTDEDAFRTLNDGISVRVGYSKTSRARYFLKDTRSVAKLLSRISDLFEQPRGHDRSQ